MIYPQNFEHKIGFDEIRRLVKGRCISSLGVERADKATFMTDAEAIQTELEKIREYARFSLEEEGIYEENFCDVRQQLLSIRPERTYLEEIDLFDLKHSLETIHQLVTLFQKDINGNPDNPQYKYPHLQKRSVGVETFPDIIQQIGKTLNKYGKINDSASPELLSIRRELDSVTKSISRTLRNIIHEAQDEGYIDHNTSPSMRDGRLVIPVSPAFKRKIRGIVHDESATGKTVFIEPAAIVEANNHIRELKAAERREVIKILQQLSAAIRPHISSIIESLLFLGEIDFVRAKMLFSQTIRATIPSAVQGQSEIEWYHAVHPLLQLNLEKHGKEAVPLDLKLTASQRILLISGPNAGGKSICLKTVGLLQYMVQCGFPVPINEGSTIGVFENIFIDIGDDQSLENDLSTYSSHLLNMRHMLKNSNARTLLLIDEFGSGTEPQIGGAIAEAMLKRFIDSRTFGVITTHFQNLKMFAETHDEIVNGAMLYNLQELQPLFILQMGSPGSSFALEIARKIGIPADIVADAATIVGEDYIMSDEYLREINRNKRYWENKRQNIRKREKQLEETLARYESELTQLHAQKKELIHQAKADAENLLKASNAKIEQTIRTIRETQAEKERTKEVRQELETFRNDLIQDQAEKEDHVNRKIEQIKQRRQRYLERKANKASASQPSKETPKPATAKRRICVGDTVCIKGQNTTGRVETIQGRTARVLFGVMHTTIPLDRLEHASQPAASLLGNIVKGVETTTRQTIDEKKLNFRTDIDLRGFRGDEALNAVRSFVDDAMMLGVPRVRILHGTGTGVLRQLIRQYLSTVPGISFRDEHVQFGGAGITVVDLE